MVNTWKLIAATLLIFAAGVLTGGVAVGLAGWMTRDNPSPPAPTHLSPDSMPEAGPVRSRPSSTRSTRFPRPGNSNLLGTPASDGSQTNVSRRDRQVRPPGWTRMEVMRRLQDELDLEPDQRVELETLFQTTEQRMRAHWSPVAPAVQTELRTLREEIAKILTETQQTRFEELLRKPARD